MCVPDRILLASNNHGRLQHRSRKFSNPRMTHTQNSQELSAHALTGVSCMQRKSSTGLSHRYLAHLAPEFTRLGPYLHEHSDR
jgi:hypothetical protein